MSSLTPTAPTTPPSALLVDLSPVAAALVADALRTAEGITRCDPCASAALDPRPDSAAPTADIALCGVGPTRSTRLDPLRRLTTAHPLLPVVLLLPPEDAPLARALADEPRIDVVITTPGYLDQLPLCVVRAARRAARMNDLARSADHILRDNHELTRLVSQLRDLATTDPLTGLLNRRGLLARLDEFAASALRYQHDLALAAIDIDGLKAVNDTRGHSVGDQLLRAAADAIRTGIRASDAPARVGGDEFVILLPRTAAPQAAIVAARIQSTFDKAARELALDPASVGMSVGIATLDADAESPTRLLDRADIAMYRAKHEGGRRVCTDLPRPRLAA